MTFLVGVVLGGVVIAVTSSGGDQPSAGGGTSTSTSAETTTPGSTTATTRPAATVTIPGPCLQVADDSKSVLNLVNQAAAAARDLDASHLSDIVRQLQEARTTVQKDAAACRDAATTLPTP